MEKINIKSPHMDSLRGTGVEKLGWTEGNKVIGTVKRLTASFSTDSVGSKRSNKQIGKCPHCQFEFRTNNPDRVPDHQEDKGWYWSMHRNNNDRRICQGAWTQQREPALDAQIEMQQISVGTGWGKPVEVIQVGDSVLIDFTRAVLKEYWPGIDEIKQVTLERIVLTQSFRRDGTLYCEGRELYFSEVPKPINQAVIDRWMTLA